MFNSLSALLSVLGPVSLICGLFYYAGTRSSVPSIGHLLKRTAIAWIVLMTVIWAAFAFVDADCQAAFIFGYSSCQTIAPGIGEFVLAVALLSLPVGAFYALVLAIVASIKTSRHRAAARTTEGQNS